MNDKKIKQAFEQMTPSSEAEDRMLDTILAATDAEKSRAAEESNDSVATESPVETPGEKLVFHVKHSSSESGINVNSSSDDHPNSSSDDLPDSSPDDHPGSSPDYRSAKKSGRPLWRIALPVAASLVLLAGIGLFAASSLNKADMQTQQAEMASSGSEPQDSAELVPGDGQASDDADSSQDASEDVEDNREAESSTLYEEQSSALRESESDTAERFPTLEVDSVGRLYIILDDSSKPRAVSPDNVGEKIAEGTARSADGSKTKKCAIYAYPAADMVQYAVLYEGDTTYYLAAPLAR